MGVGVRDGVGVSVTVGIAVGVCVAEGEGDSVRLAVIEGDTVEVFDVRLGEAVIPCVSVAGECVGVRTTDRQEASRITRIRQRGIRIIFRFGMAFSGVG